jgi:hypothetical protein
MTDVLITLSVHFPDGTPINDGTDTELIQEVVSASLSATFVEQKRQISSISP